jgi:hypothetical protein
VIVVRKISAVARKPPLASMGYYAIHVSKGTLHSPRGSVGIVRKISASASEPSPMASPCYARHVSKSTPLQNKTDRKETDVTCRPVAKYDIFEFSDTESLRLVQGSSLPQEFDVER